MKTKICRICDSKIAVINNLLPGFNHKDFKKISNRNIFYKCSYCYTVSNPKNFYKNFFLGKDYAISKANSPKIFMNDKLIEKFKAQIFFLKKQKLLNDNSIILDIGCYEGDLIKSIKDKFKQIQCYGYDINKFIKKKLLKKNFFFDIYKKNKKIKFDLIIISHAIMYFKDLNLLFKNIKKLLKKNGVLYIEIPDITQSPYYSLMGDQTYMLTKKSLFNILSIHKFNSKLYEPKILNGNLVFLAKLSTKFSKVQLLKDNIIENSLKELTQIRTKISMIKSKFYILGTTVKAAFIYSIAKKKAIGFLDESKSTKSFCNLNVKHPEKLKKNDLVIVPLKDKKNIFFKLKKKFKGNFKLY